MLKSFSTLLVFMFIGSTFSVMAQTVNPTVLKKIEPKKPAVQMKKTLILPKLNRNSVNKPSPNTNSGQMKRRLITPRIIKRTILAIDIEKDLPFGTPTQFRDTKLFRALCEKAITIKIHDQNGKLYEVKPKYRLHSTWKKDYCGSSLKLPTNATYNVEVIKTDGIVRFPTEEIYIAPMQKDAHLTEGDNRTLVKFKYTLRN